MQTIRIVIADGKAQSVEINEATKPRTTKEIAEMLYLMPKEKLAEALSIAMDGERRDVVDERSIK